MRACKLTILALGLALGLGDSAHADDYWVPPIGGTCVPDSATVRAGVYETAGFGVRFSGNSIGKIRLLCPLNLTTDVGPFSGMRMSFIDADGMEAGGRIRAHLRRAAVGTNIWIAIGTCDSNTSDTTAPHVIFCPFDHYQSNRSEWYWWDVEIERTTPSVNVEFLGVEVRYQAEEFRPSGRPRNPAGRQRR
jgi:hypothetical protein